MAMTTPSPAAPQAVSPWLLAATVPLAAFMEILDTTIVNVAVPHIGGSLSSGIDEATYAITSYLIANVIVIPLSGYLTGLLGRKNYYLWSVAIFTIASALCGFAPSLGWLVFFRVLQGLGGGGLQPLSQAIVMDAFPREKQSAAQSVFSITVVLGPMLGPVFGGWLTDNYSWRWIFLVNVPIGILAFVLNSRLIQDPPHIIRYSLKERRFDFQGLSLLAIGLGCLQFVLDRGQIDDWFGSRLITAFTLFSTLAVIGFVWRELAHDHPIVDLRLLKSTGFALSVVAMFVMGFVFYAANYLQPLFCQGMLGWTATWAGLTLSPSGIVTILMAPFMPKLLRRVRAQYVVFFGFIIHGLACLVMVGWNLQIPYWKILETRMFQIVGLTLLMVPINVMGFAFLKKEKVTSGSGLLSLARNFGTSCGVSLAATLLARRSQIHQGMLTAHLTPADESYRTALSQATQVLFHHGSSFADATLSAVALVGRELERQAMMLSYMDAFWLLVVCSFLAAPLPLLIRRPKAAPSDAKGKEVAHAE
jgi:DHA2 family multidrug resistance protein